MIRNPVSSVRASLFVSIALVVGIAGPAIALAEPCDAEQLERILAPAREDDTRARVECDLDLTPLMAAAITRTLELVGAGSSGVTLDCHDGVLGSADAPASILIASERIGSSPLEGVGTFGPVTDVTIRGCELHGSVRIRGMGTEDATRSSHVPLGHVARLRAAAPRRITFDRVTFVGTGRVPLYIGAGVEDTTVVRSHFTGRSDACALYLDAESRGATVRECTFETETTREVIAVDSSEENRFIGNWLSNLDRGGIYLYRNCGERGFVRFTPSRHNEIIDNVFFYRHYDGPHPAVFFGADDGFSTHRFCHEDLEHPFGSGADDRDYTRWNAVIFNQIHRRSPAEVLHTEWPETNTPNYVENNTSVESAVSRPAGCFVRDAHEPRSFRHGETLRVTTDRDGRPYESPVEVTCVDGDLAYASTPELRPVRELAFSCSASGDNAGCHGEVRCPEGAVLVGAHAACNLEWGAVRDAQLAAVPRDTLHVVRSSDVGLLGRCWVGSEGAPGGEISLAGVLRGSAAGFGCREHDRNGGDCHIVGVAYCAEL